MALPIQPDESESTRREAAIRTYQPLVAFVARRLMSRFPSAVLEYEDLLSYGTIGLIEAVDRYDDSKGVKFQTYAISRVRGAILDALRSLDRLPRSVRRKAKTIEQMHARFAQEHGREPTDEEAASAIGLSLYQYQRALIDCSWVTVSLDGLVDRDNNDDGTAPTELPSDPDAEDFTERLEKRQLVDELAGAVKRLPGREWLIVSLYYRDEMTMKEIAQIMEISESRVSQLCSRALERLRASLAAA